MRPRAFRLGSVLGVRKRQLDLARCRLAALVQEQEQDETERRRLLDVADHTASALYDELLAGGPAAILQTAGLALDVASGAAQGAERRARSRDSSIEVARLELAEAKRRVRGLEILDERARQREAVWQARRAQMMLDELGTRRHGKELA